jgi:hypothetical protein
LVEASTYLLSGDHDGTTAPPSGMTSISVCSACGPWPTRLGIGATTRFVVGEDEADGHL